MSSTSSAFVAAFTVLVGLLLAGDAAAQPPVTDDAHTNIASGEANFGHHPNLTASSAGPVYLRFDLATLADGTPRSLVDRAVLTLYVGNVVQPGALEVYEVAQPWSEGTITAAGAPPLGLLTAITPPIAKAQRHTFVSIDVTGLVQQWLGDDGHGLNGAPNYGLALVAQPGTDVTFDSKENSQTSHEPRLHIQLASGAGGGSGIHSVTADAPISVTGAAQAPHLSLGVVGATFGGTGLASPGTSGNFLRSDGATWITAPLTAADLPDFGTTFIKNDISQQPSANFNIGGTGAAQIFNATMQYNLGGQRALSNAGVLNLFAGVNGGGNGSQNAFFGAHAGEGNLTGGGNSFFGAFAARKNTEGSENSFFGNFAGLNNTSGHANSFFGVNAGSGNETGEGNSFFGKDAGARHRSGIQNAFVGQAAGFNTLTGSRNTFLGSNAGGANATGSDNTIVGAFANVAAGSLDHATAIGAGAVVATSNTIVLGRSVDTVQVPGNLNLAGTFGANIVSAATQFNLGGQRILITAGQDNLFVGIGAGAGNTIGFNNSFLGANAGITNSSGSDNAFFGRFAGASNTIGGANAFFGADAAISNTTGILNSSFGAYSASKLTTGIENSFFGASAGFETTTGNANAFFGRAGVTNTTGSNNTLVGYKADVGAGNLNFATALGAGAKVNTSNTVVLGRAVDTVQIPGAFKVAGSFGANILDAATQYNLGGVRMLVANGSFNSPGLTFSATNTFVGDSAGLNTTPDPTGQAPGRFNSFVGLNAGSANINGHSNSFFGSRAGESNTHGLFNSFFGTGAGIGNTTASFNSFFGASAGSANTTGVQNSFFGRDAGISNTTGSGNVFIGVQAGILSTTSNSNTFVGINASFDSVDPTGDNNTLMGAQARVTTGVSNAAAIGYRAQVSQNNSLVLGSIKGVNFATADTNVGIGTPAPKAKLDVTGGNILVGSPGQGIVLKSPDAAQCRLLSIDNSGGLALTPVACP